LLVVVGSIAIAAICAVSLSATLATLYDDAIGRSKRESAEFAAVLAGQTSRSVEAINLVLEELAQRITRPADHKPPVKAMMLSDASATWKRISTSSSACRGCLSPT
jgi:hypothetical protein